MFWIIALGITTTGTLINLLITRPATLTGVAEVALVWLLGAFFGLFTLLAGLQHVFNAEKIAKFIGWPTSGFQHELGWAEVGLGIAGMLAVIFRGPYVIAPAVVGAVLYLGAALVHIQDMRKTKNFNPGNAGPVFYIDIIVPLLVIVMVMIYAPWR
jgi:hypothetical protein